MTDDDTYFVSSDRSVIHTRTSFLTSHTHQLESLSFSNVFQHIAYSSRIQQSNLVITQFINVCMIVFFNHVHVII